jgi:hypothetical protein
MAFTERSRIENSLHWCLDVTFREDESRLRDRIAADNLEWLRKLATSVLKQVDSTAIVVMRGRIVSWSEEFLTQVLGPKER